MPLPFSLYDLFSRIRRFRVTTIEDTHFSKRYLHGSGIYKRRHHDETVMRRFGSVAAFVQPALITNECTAEEWQSAVNEVSDGNRIYTPAVVVSENVWDNETGLNECIKKVLTSEEEQYASALLLFFVNEEILQHPCAEVVAQLRNEGHNYRTMDDRLGNMLFVVLPTNNRWISDSEIRAVLPAGSEFSLRAQ